MEPRNGQEFKVKPLLNRTEQFPPKATEGEVTSCLPLKTFDSRPRSFQNKLVDLPPPPLFDPKLLESGFILSLSFLKLYNRNFDKSVKIQEEISRISFFFNF